MTKAIGSNIADPHAKSYFHERQNFWDQASIDIDKSKSWGKYYHQRLSKIFQNIVPLNQSVIEFGCGQGDLLSSLNPIFGVGVDFSAGMIQRAKRRHPDLHFIQAEVHDTCLHENFDFIIISDLLNELWDVQKVFEQASKHAGQHTRVIINSYSRVWELPLLIAQKLRVAQPVLQRNWLTVEDINNLLNLADFEIILSWHEILCPLPIPIIASFTNKFLGKLWPFNRFALSNFIIARPKPQSSIHLNAPSVSLIIPARNEAGNIADIFARTPVMGKRTELIFVEGHSTDLTYETIQEGIKKNPDRPCQLLRQSGVGKGDAVRLGFSRALGDILIVFDADLTVPPEDLPRFYHALITGKGEFINGVRLVYPMGERAMRAINFLGNKFFAIAFSWVVGQPIKDTLCGTKALWRSDYERISANRSYFGDFDPFGDFDLIFGAVKLNLKIIDLPIRYRDRTYGETNIHRWKHGWLLIKMLLFGAWRLKFI